MKMDYYKPVMITINALGLAQVIIDMVIRHHGFLDSINTHWGFLFTLKFWSSLWYFLGIKSWLFTAFYSQINNQIQRQNSTMKAFFQAFINFEKNN